MTDATITLLPAGHRILDTNRTARSEWGDWSTAIRILIGCSSFQGTINSSHPAAAAAMGRWEGGKAYLRTMKGDSRIRSFRITLKSWLEEPGWE